MKNNESFYGQKSSFREKSDQSSLQGFALEIVAGRVCQLNCESCYKSGGEGDGKGRIPFEEAKDYISQAHEAGFKELILMGGEPSLHKNIFDLIDHIRGEDMSPILCTNGIFLSDEENVTRLANTGTTIVTHAYFPEGDEIIDAYSGKNGYAKQLKQAISNLKETPGTTLVMEMPLADSLFSHAFDFFKFCRQEGIIPFIEISRSTDAGDNTSSITPEKVAELFLQFQKFDQEYYPELTDKHITPPAYGNKCTMSMTGLHVKNYGRGEYGKVYSCCAQGILQGDLKEKSLKEIMQNPTISLFMDQDRYIVGPCADCDIYELCKGGCRGEAFLKFGCPRASSPACHLIPSDIRYDATIMAPSSCDGCPGEDCADCGIK